ncbi:hypothetical protein MJT46_009423 [Ovis ammon polii x Ovis aries]|nr:hypothetical protein MJT46_009423 [Ovis ammon polii x Ovis aries]
MKITPFLLQITGENELQPVNFCALQDSSVLQLFQAAVIQTGCDWQYEFILSNKQRWELCTFHDYTRILYAVLDDISSLLGNIEECLTVMKDKLKMQIKDPLPPSNIKRGEKRKVLNTESGFRPSELYIELLIDEANHGKVKENRPVLSDSSNILEKRNLIKDEVDALSSCSLTAEGFLLALLYSFISSPPPSSSSPPRPLLVFIITSH